MINDLPEKLKPIAESWKPGENTILYAESGDGTITTLVLGSRYSIKATLYDLTTNIAEKLDMRVSDLVSELVGYDVLKEILGDEDETKENH